MSDDETRYQGYRFWCSGCHSFVDRRHRCEQWSQITYIPPDAIMALTKDAAEAERARCGAALREALKNMERHWRRTSTEPNPEWYDGLRYDDVARAIERICGAGEAKG